MSALPLDPLPLGAGSDAKLSGGRHRRSRRHLGFGVTGGLPDAMPPAEGGRRRRRHSRRGRGEPEAVPLGGRRRSRRHTRKH